MICAIRRLQGQTAFSNRSRDGGIELVPAPVLKSAVCQSAGRSRTDALVNLPALVLDLVGGITRLRLFRLPLRQMASINHHIQELADQAKGVYLIVMAAGREGQQFSTKVGVPRRRHRHVQTIDRHPATDGLRPHRLVSTRGELLAVHEGLVASRLLLDEWSDTSSNLAFLLGPIQRTPLSHKATPLTHPDFSGRLAAP